MATIVKAYILCPGESAEALEAVTRMLGGACFETGSGVEDYALGVAGVVPGTPSVLDGELISRIPGAAGCQTSDQLGWSGP